MASGNSTGNAAGNTDDNTLIFALIALAIAGRLIPHPDNFTPVAAMALFAGALLPGWRASAAVLTALVVSDVLLGFAPDVFSVAVYAGFLASIALGRWLGAQRTVLKTASAAIGGSLIFFIITNFSVWAMPEAHGGVNYDHGLTGLIDCYVAALPFLRNALAGDLFWAALLFGLHDFSRARQLHATPIPVRHD